MHRTSTLSHSGATCTPTEVSDAVIRERLDPDVDPLPEHLQSFESDWIFVGGKPARDEVLALLETGQPFTVSLW
jgi:hypothetical protein